MSRRRCLISSDEEATHKLGAELAACLAPDGLLLLYGDLGSGKTVLTKGVAAGLGIPAAEIRSPTFTLVHEHDGPRGALHHVDLYRLASEEVGEIGLEEILARPGVKVVEWAERLASTPRRAVRLRCERLPDGRHRFEELGESSPDDIEES